MYLLDTNILSDLLKPRPSTSLIAKLASVPPEDQFTSSITLGELIFGALRRPERTDYLLRQIDALVVQNVPVLPFDAAAAEHYGRVRAALESAGTPIEEPDLRIAAVALANGLIMVTGNLRHFQRIPGLVVEDWLRG
jgi:tRNA(fMet)-specific endonuclease VapC